MMTAPRSLHPLAGLAIALAACTPTPPATVGPSPATACLVADTAATSVDTIRYVADGPAPSIDFLPEDCASNPQPIAQSRLPTPELIALPPGTDLRDVLDRGFPPEYDLRADLVFTRNPDVLAYAARRDDYRSVALPWDVTYALALPAADSALPPDSAQRDALARDAVSVDARGALAPFWWQADTCTRPAAALAVTPRPVVGFPAGDPTARQLAERIVALAASPERPAWIPAAIGAGRLGALRTESVPGDSLADAMASGRLAAAVLESPRDPHTACLPDWTTPADWERLPLVDTRPHVLVRRGSGVRFYVRSPYDIRILPSWGR